MDSFFGMKPAKEAREVSDISTAGNTAGSLVGDVAGNHRRPNRFKGIDVLVADHKSEEMRKA